MDVFVSYDGDHIGREVGRAILTDDVEQVRRTDQAIQSGNDLWRKFAENVGGSVVEIGGDEGRICIGADHLDEVQKLAEQYAELVGATVSVGVGTKLSESARALLVAKLRGGNQILLWQDSMAAELDAAKEKPEGEKIAEEYLNKATTAANEGAHAGFEGRTEPVGGAVNKPMGGQHDHSQEQQMYDTIAQAQENQVPVEQTHAAQDFEEALHQAAQEQSKKDEQSKVDVQNDHEDLRKQVVAVLQKVKQTIPVLAQVKQSSPETYQAVMFLVQSVVSLGRELMGNEPQPMQKGEAGDDFAGPKSVMQRVRDVLTDDDRKKKYQGDPNIMHGQCYVASAALYHLLADPNWKPCTVQHEGDVHWFLKHRQTGAILDPTADQFSTPPPYDKAVGRGFLTDYPDQRVEKVMSKVLGEHPEPELPMVKAEDLGKMALIWDHQAQGGQPMTVYRVQNEDGAGAYRGGAYTGEIPHDPVHRPGPFPTWFTGPEFKPDFDDNDRQAFETRDHYQGPKFFAFEKPEHATEWFGPGILTDMNKKGLKLVPVRAKRVWRSTTGRQVFFEPFDTQECSYRPAAIPGAVPPPAPVTKAEPAPAADKLPGGAADGRLPRDFDPMELSLGIEHEMEHTNDPLVAREIAMDHLTENPKYYTQLAASGIEKDEMKEREGEMQRAPVTGPELDKSASNGPISGAPAHHHLNLPVGSQVNGKIKVNHGDGGTSWKGVRSGQITAQDPDAPLFGANSHPTSTREPGAK